MDPCLGLFIREPVPGRAKTRLIPALGEAGAASLYRAFVEDTLNLALRSSARHIRAYVDGRGPESYVDPGLRGTLSLARDQERWSEVDQAAGDLGQRLHAAFDDAQADDLVPLLMIGTDGPDLPIKHLLEAQQALRTGADVVLGSAADGGVWCIGLAQSSREFLRDIPWSADHTGDALRQRSDALGLERVEVSAWYDCDTPKDLEALVARLRLAPTRAKMTWNWLTRRGLT